MTLTAVRLDRDTPELAAHYDEAGLRQFEHGKVLVEPLALASGQRVLDVGCGTGLLAAWIAQRVQPGGEVIGIDPLPLRVQRAAGKHPALHTRVGRAEDLSAFGDAGFDAVVLNSVLHWVADQPRALAEARRVLKPGGRIAVNSADPDRPHQSNALQDEVLAELGLGDHHATLSHRVDAAALQRLLADAGFADIVIIRPTFVDHVRDVDDLIAWHRASSFGNWLPGLNDDQRARVRDGLAARLSVRRRGDHVPLARHLVFATARA